MRKLLLACWAMFVLTTAQGQEIAGDWYGMLKLGTTSLRLALNFTKNDTGYVGKLISIDQGNSVIPMSWVKQDQGKLQFKTQVANIEYQGQIANENIDGTFTQNGQNFPLTFGRKKLERTVYKRPQEPKPPFPYLSEEVSFLNARDSFLLAGTLTLPASGNNFPVVILISGSGPQNRDEELMGHKPFLVLSDHLTKNGIAVLRYDDRGVGKSKGNFGTATSADFATDVLAAVQYLKTRKEINPKKIGLVGHSEGGLVAPMVANQTPDVSYIVLLAGTGVPGKDIIVLQQQLILKANGAPDANVMQHAALMKNITNIIGSGKDDRTISAELHGTLKLSYASLPDSLRKQYGSEATYIMQFASLNTAWMKYFMNYDPATALEKIKIPVLALNGSKDLQVAASQNLPVIEKALKKAGNTKYTIKELPNLNHLFQECKTGAPSEYETIEMTMSPTVLDEVTAWIKKN